MNTSPTSSGKTSSRKRDHVELCVESDVSFRQKTSGFERFEFVHNALPEIDFVEISTATTFLGKSVSFPLMISCMTGGYDEAERINREIAEVCESLQLPMGVGSQRQALENSVHHATFQAARRGAPTIALVSNIGATEVAKPHLWNKMHCIVDLIEADALTVHLNPLQELLQPEGSPTFRGVLAGIEHLVKTVGVPIIVKEVGAGISSKVAARLLDAGVAVIDVAGAGGTSWAGVEILRTENPQMVDAFWDWGIPTVDCLRQIFVLKHAHSFSLIASGGVHSGMDVAKSLALGADMTGVARVMLQILMQSGQQALHDLLIAWQRQLQSVMFLTGVATIAELQTVELLEHPV